MIRKITAAFIALFMAIGLVTPAFAAGNIDVKNSSAEVNFPLSIEFNISAESAAEITEIRLHYGLNNITFANVTAEALLDITPASEIDTSWTWDMTMAGGLPPGTHIKYWWTIKDSAGNIMSTDVNVVYFDDSRYEWQKISRDK